ncbi:hypothetical protein NC653_008325 [Populus alba x Populus x berolinensis]|uniref:Uncharacterized protein n=1 Tax=Populus alba x Populus x berolinensis TaxID=444605 RepID=A0AAD6W8F2_9ROSI|nr:hypothetical protein NC653_008325 [Populus alba x Populus x berolinensis]
MPLQRMGCATLLTRRGGLETPGDGAQNGGGGGFSFGSYSKNMTPSGMVFFLTFCSESPPSGQEKHFPCYDSLRNGDDEVWFIVNNTLMDLDWASQDCD